MTDPAQIWRVIHGQVEDALADESLGRFDAVLCDPPYGLTSGKNSTKGFMDLAWDRGVPSAEVWRLVRARIYPGSYVVAFGGTRTWHRLAGAMEDSGLEMRDSILAWLYGGGWPKPADVGKFVDKAIGATRPVVGVRTDGATHQTGANLLSLAKEYNETTPGSLWGRTWDGWHANLKPAWEPALVFREPGPSLARCALEHGVAGLAVDANRIPASGRPLVTDVDRPKTLGAVEFGSGMSRGPKQVGTTDLGRWPANVVLCCDEDVCGEDATEHEPGCPVRELDDQAGQLRSGRLEPHHAITKGGDASCFRSHSDRRKVTRTFGGDAGGASRFFYRAKVSRRERGSSKHPCMKPIALCRHLAGLLLQPPFRRRRLLVPYSGSGSEMIGGLLAGWDEVVGVEADLVHVEESRERIPAELAYWRARETRTRR